MCKLGFEATALWHWALCRSPHKKYPSARTIVGPLSLSWLDLAGQKGLDPKANNRGTTETNKWFTSLINIKGLQEHEMKVGQSHGRLKPGRWNKNGAAKCPKQAAKIAGRCTGNKIFLCFIASSVWFWSNNGLSSCYTQILFSFSKYSMAPTVIAPINSKTHCHSFITA